jgi:hypothetical protein
VPPVQLAVSATGSPFDGSVTIAGLIEQAVGAGGNTVAGADTGDEAEPLKAWTVYAPAAVATSCGTVVETCAPPGSVHR